MRKYRFKINREELSSLPLEIKEKLQKELILLEPYFLLPEGEKTFLEVLKIVFEDKNSNYTTLMPKPSDFKTDAQKEGLGDKNVCEITINQFRSGVNNYDFFFIQLMPVFFNKTYFNLIYSFYQKNFFKLKFNYFWIKK